MLIYHVASRVDWTAAESEGSYRISTRGRTLEQEGFVHCSRADQVAGVLAGFYADAPEALVLLALDTDRLDQPWQEDEVAPGLRFPHVYGPLTPAAVVGTTELTRDRDGRFLLPAELG